MNKKQTQLQVELQLYDLICNSDPSTTENRRALITRLVNSRLQLLADVVQCKSKMIKALTLDEQRFYRREAKKRQQQAESVVHALRLLAQYIVDEKVAAAVMAELL